MNQTFDFDAGAKYARYGFLLGYLIEQRTEKPAWNRGDFFGEHCGKTKKNCSSRRLCGKRGS